MANFMKRDTLNVGIRPQSAAIGIPCPCGIKHNIALGHSRTGITVVGHSQRAPSKTVSEKAAAKREGITAVTRSNRRGGVHHPSELNAPHYLVPHVDRWRDCGIPRSITVAQSSASRSEFQLH